MTDPKQVSDFAKEYQEMYIALVQCKSAYAEVCKERDKLKLQIMAKTKVKPVVKPQGDPLPPDPTHPPKP